MTMKKTEIDHFEDCSLNKIRRRDLLKSNSKPSDKVGERIYLDILWLNVEIFGVNKYCFLIVDELSGMTWRRFGKQKSDLSEKNFQS